MFEVTYSSQVLESCFGDQCVSEIEPFEHFEPAERFQPCVCNPGAIQLELPESRKPLKRRQIGVGDLFVAQSNGNNVVECRDPVQVVKPFTDPLRNVSFWFEIPSGAIDGF